MRRKPIKNKITLKSDPKQILKVETFLERINDRLHLSDIKFNKLLVATTEAVNNSIIHGNKRDPNKKVTVTCECGQDMLIIRVYDEGRGIDPASIPNPLAEENLLRENGRGIFLMRSLMDEIEFLQTKTGSEVILKMKL